MTFDFEELDHQKTPLGEISLRRRAEPKLEGKIVYEVKLGDEFLMSSLFTVAEEELARLGLAAASAEPGATLEVVVGGLGLGYTACTALEDPRVGSLIVVDALEEVITWHREGLLPFAAALTTDPRCRLVHGDFFALTADAAGYDPEQPGRPVDVILLDVDHSPRHLLNPRHAPLYTADGLRRLAAHLRPGGVFALWSDDAPDGDFLAVLHEVFAGARAEVVTFDSPFHDGTSANTVYVASL